MNAKSKRKLRLSQKDRREIFQKTNGHCHFCGDKLVFENRGRGSGPGAWEADHVVQLARDEGEDKIGNYLPACAACNQLRWYFDGDNLRNLLTIGLVGNKAIKNNTTLGQQLKDALAEREKANAKRRRSPR